jgi:hypothetical protein
MHDQEPRVDGGAQLCGEHAWASIGVTVVDGDVTRVWVCERCPAWTRELLDDATEVAWDDTRLSRL